MTALLFALLSGLAAAALAFAFLQPRLAKEKRSAARLGQMKSPIDRAVKTQMRDRAQEQAKRRRTLQSSLKQIEEKQRERARHSERPSIRMQIEQAGLTLTVRAFHLYGAAAGLVVALLVLVLSGKLLLALSAGFVAGLGLPRLVLSQLRKRRLKQFMAEFPNAIDLVVRGVKSGLPLNDTLKMIAGETAEPVRSEFRKVIESQQLGMTVGEAVERLYQNVPVPETNFFAIVIAIQSQAGGNLSEALGNLSRVLRDRKKMRDKVQAMSMEAKASAGIIGFLPFAVAGILTVTSPDYIALLFTTLTGNYILAASALWMCAGVFVMKKMIAFDI